MGPALAHPLEELPEEPKLALPVAKRSVISDEVLPDARLSTETLQPSSNTWPGPRKVTLKDQRISKDDGTERATLRQQRNTRRASDSVDDGAGPAAEGDGESEAEVSSSGPPSEDESDEGGFLQE